MTQETPAGAVLEFEPWAGRFSERVVLVTGAAGGLGAQAVQRLHSEGAIVIATDIRRPDTGHAALSLELDVADPEAWAQAAQRIRDAYGRLDGALFCHGIQGPEHTIQDVPIAGWKKTLEINLDGCFYGLQVVVPLMRQENYGRIVMLSSIAGREGNENMSAYAVSKAGLITLAKTVAKETARNGITINCIAPSMFNTRLLEDLSAERNAALLARVPMQRVGEPQEFSALALWLLSPEASYMTGQVLDLSGGRNTA